MNNLWEPTVLIVDDDRISRTVLAELLKDDCRVILAKDGASALRLAETEVDIHLILLDVSMPDMDGYSVLAGLRANERTRETSVVFITALTDEDEEERGLALGAVDYISKPIRPAIARARICNHLKLAMQHRALERIAESDALTGLANRRSFDKVFELAYRHTVRTGESMGLAMIDVDYFKQYNDLYGHAAGDEALRQIAGVLKKSAQRSYDLAARYGGEEFVLLIPRPDYLETLLEKLRQDIVDLRIVHEGSPFGVISLSCGAVQFTGKLAHDSTMALRKADELLYKAKDLGRNRVLVETGL